MAKSGNLSVSTDISKRLDITCRKGDTFEMTIDATDAEGDAVAFGSYSDIALEVRPTDEDSGTPVLSFDYPADFNTAVAGKLVISKSATVMAAVTAGVYVYDMQLTDSAGKTVTWFYGLFKINDDVTI
jgi:hypothetical protein